LAIAMAGKSG